MLKEFNEIIGYESVKRELECTLDILNDKERYARLGVSIPNGLLLHGNPGMGKTSIAKCFIEASGRRSVICKKTSPDGEFVKEIKNAFDEAVECVPSILLLDDMDKFANDDINHRNSDEYVTVQACIDDVKGKDVFVLATTNELCNLPDSLTRSGRFDRVIKLQNPSHEDASLIVRHYLSDKAIDDDVDVSVIADILDGRSCADLESVINQAGMLAGFDHEDSISFENIINASLIKFHDVPLGSIRPVKRDEKELRNISSALYWHEAGHAAMREILYAGSVVLAYANAGDDDFGFVQANRKDLASYDFSIRIADIMVSLSGKAAVEIVFGIRDEGAASDVKDAIHSIDSLNDRDAFSGFIFAAPRMSESYNKNQMREVANTALLNFFYSKVKKTLIENKGFMEAIAYALYEKTVLTQLDIKAIRDTFEIRQPTLL